MMYALPVMIVIWAVFTGLFLMLLAYNSTITRYEENQLFLEEISAHEKQKQTSIASQITKVLPFMRATGALSAVMTVLIITVYTIDAWHRIH